MSSPAPTSDNDYQFPPSPMPGLLSRHDWNAVMASLAARLRELEAVGTGIGAIREELSSLGLAIINDAVTPLIADVEQRVAVAEQALAAIEAFVEDVIDGMLVADNVTVAPIEGFPDRDNAQAVFEALAADVIAAAVATEAEATAGEDNAKRMTALRTRQAIDELAGSENTLNVTSNLTMQKGKRYRLIGTTARTLTLPASPAAGDTVRIVDGGSISATVNHTVARNGKTIMGLSENLVLDVAGISVMLWYSGSDWRLF